MKSTTFFVALIGSSAVSAIELRLAKSVSAMSEVLVTRTVTVTTFQGAVPTNDNNFAQRCLQETQGSGGQALESGRPAPSPVENMPGVQQTNGAQEIPEPSNEAINVQAPMPKVIMPTIPAFSKVGKPVVGNGTQDYAAAVLRRPGTKAHNGTFPLLHVTNNTASDWKDQHHNKTENFQKWRKNVEEGASSKVKQVQDSALPVS